MEKEKPSPKQLLNDPGLLDAHLPATVDRFFKQDPNADLAEVAQWCVDKDEPRVLRALYDDGFRGPIRLNDVARRSVLQALLELDDLPLNPLQVKLEFANRVEPDHVPLLTRVLRTHNLSVHTLWLDLSSELPPAAVSDLLAAVDALAELKVLRVLVDGQAKGPIAQALAQAILGCQRALILSGDTVIPLLVRDAQRLERSNPAFAIELKDFLRNIEWHLAHASWQAQAEKNFPLFKQALRCSEYGLMRALMVLGWAPLPQNCLDFSGLPLPPAALDQLKRWDLGFRFIVELRSSLQARQLGEWLKTCRPCLRGLVLNLSAALDEDALHALATVLQGLGPSFQRLSVTVADGFVVQVPSQAAPTASPSSALAVVLLNLGTTEQPPPGRSAALARLIEILQPVRLEVVAPVTGVVLGLLDALPNGQHFPWLASLNIVCAAADAPAPRTLQALETFFARFHGPKQFRFDGGRYQWEAVTRGQVWSMVLRNDTLMDIQLNALDAHWKLTQVIACRVLPEAHLRQRVFTRGKLHPGMAAREFFPAHLHGHLQGELAEGVIDVGGLTPRDQLALSLVSTKTRAAGVLGRKVLALAHALFDGALDALALNRLLACWPSGERDAVLKRALARYVAQRALQAENESAQASIAWRAVQGLLREEDALWQRQQQALDGRL
jgi:hypothetical protein